MYIPISFIVIVIFVVCSVTPSVIMNEVCDVEGSAVGDCSESTHCCKQSQCDALYRKLKGKRCCTKIERDQKVKSHDCVLCTQCCEEFERNIVPLPQHCSKCRSCNDLLTEETDLKIGEVEYHYKFY